MDDKRFDALVKSLAGRRDRRAMLKGLLSIGGAAVGAAVLRDGADAARRGYPGPRWPGQPPGECEPTCGNGLCGGPDGCGGICTCGAVDSCISGVCAPPCDPAQCTLCINDGPRSGCFWETTLTCSGDTECQAQFGGSLCEETSTGQSFCFVPRAPV